MLLVVGHARGCCRAAAGMAIGGIVLSLLLLLLWALL